MGVKVTIRQPDAAAERPAKKAKKAAVEEESKALKVVVKKKAVVQDEEEEYDEAWDQEEEQWEAADPKDLEAGAVVFYWDGCRGVVRDAYAPLDEYWIIDEETGELVRDKQGDIVPFKSAQLQLAAPPPRAPEAKAGEEVAPFASVLVIGTEAQMLRMLQHFGSPDTSRRHQPQQLLAIPCNMCDKDNILPTASEGIDEGIRELAQKLRPEITVAVRAYHMKHAVEMMGTDLFHLDGYYCLASVCLPYGKDDLAASHGWEKKFRRDTCNQIDVHVTSVTQCVDGETSSEETARRALGEQCGMTMVDTFWAEEVQQALRRGADVQIPVKFEDVNGFETIVLMMPEDAVAVLEDGILCFSEAPGRDYTVVKPAFHAKKKAAPRVEEPVPRSNRAPEVDAGPELALPVSSDDIGGKTVGEWEDDPEFRHLPKPPAPWVRVKSRKNGDVYFFNKKTHEASFELPLPEGWTKQVSKSTGKTYYFHAKKRQSQFTAPTE